LVAEYLGFGPSGSLVNDFVSFHLKFFLIFDFSVSSSLGARVRGLVVRIRVCLVRFRLYFNGGSQVSLRVHYIRYFNLLHNYDYCNN